MAQATHPPKKSKKPRKKRSPVARFFARLGVAVLILFILAGIGGLGVFAYLYSTTELPDPNKDFQTNTTFIYYDDGTTEMGQLSVQNRTTLDYAEMPQVIKDAVVAAENRTFWTDPGFSVTGILRSAWSIATGGDVQGGSTITQQYIKILYLDSGQRLSRKINELILAAKMGRELSKEQILEGYLNTIYFGRGAYGIQAASQSFFNKDAKDLTLPEAATLATILNSPGNLNPSDGEAALARILDRYRYVLDGMLELGYISQAQYDEAYPALPEFPEIPVSETYGGPKGFLMKMVEAELGKLGFTPEEIQGGGLEVTTTINQEMNQAAIDTAQEYTNKAATKARQPQDPDDLHVSIATVDTATGAIKAAYGGADYLANQLNWATTARPAASTFKTFAAVAALENGFSLRSMLKGNTYTPRGEGVPVSNSGNVQYGPVTLRKAISSSVNTAFVDLVEQMEDGISQVVKAANAAGAPTNDTWEKNNRIALGGAEVSPINMANAYATLANDGKYNDAHIVAKVVDAKGEVRYQAKAANKEAIESNVAANVTDALTSVVNEGTATKASALNRPVAGKTGTHEVVKETQAGWFVGYTKQLSTAVMYVAGESGTAPLEPYRPPTARGFFGGGYPLETWVEYMKKATDGMPVEEFTDPKAIRATAGTEEVSVRPSPSREPSPEPVESPTPSESPVAPPSPSMSPSDDGGGVVTPSASPPPPSVPPSEGPITPPDPSEVPRPTASTAEPEELANSPEP